MTDIEWILAVQEKIQLIIAANNIKPTTQYLH